MHKKMWSDELPDIFGAEYEPEDYRLWCYGGALGGKGGGGGGSPPPAPDPAATAAAQAAANKEAVREQAVVNQIDQFTPYGSMVYSGEIGQPGRAVTQTLAPEQQAILDLNNQAATKYGQTANNQLDAVQGTLSQPLDLSALGAAPVANEGYRNQVADSLYGRVNPQLDRDREILQTQLANQGIQIGSEAYQDAVGDFDRSRNDMRLAIDAQAGNEMQRQFGLEAATRDRATNELIQQRTQPLNELASMLTGSQVQSPSFVNTPQAPALPADIMGATYGSYNGQLNAYNTQQQIASADRQGLYNLLGTAATAFAFSDRRLKRNIKRIGENNGLPVYSFDYVWGESAVGYMADEVKELYPGAVVSVGGFDAVDYARIG